MTCEDAVNHDPSYSSVQIFLAMCPKCVPITKTRLAFLGSADMMISLLIGDRVAELREFNPYSSLQHYGGNG